MDVLLDGYTRERLTENVAGSMRSYRVLDVLAQLISTHGAPSCLRSDNGPDSVLQTLMAWVKQEEIWTAMIDHGRLMRNGVKASFNGNV